MPSMISLNRYLLSVNNSRFNFNVQASTFLHINLDCFLVLLVSTSTRLVVDWILMDIWYFHIDGNVESWCHNDYRVWQGAIGGQRNDTCYMVTLHTRTLASGLKDWLMIFWKVPEWFDPHLWVWLILQSVAYLIKCIKLNGRHESKSMKTFICIQIQ